MDHRESKCDPNPTPTPTLTYPRGRLIFLGTDEQLKDGKTVGSYRRGGCHLISHLCHFLLFLILSSHLDGYIVAGLAFLFHVHGGPILNVVVVDVVG